MSYKSKFHDKHPDYKPQNDTTTMRARIESTIDELAAETDALKQSELFQNYLTFRAAFHRYSFTNSILIFSQRPDATLVAGFKAWNKIGRHVKKGAKGIAIWFPSKKLISSETPAGEDEPLKDYDMRFYIGYVFDVSDTEGDPLPDLPDWHSPEVFPVLHDAILTAMRADGIVVTENVETLHGADGASKRGRVDLAPNAGTETAIHEWVHEKYHWSENKGHKTEELEAEGTAFVVAKHFGHTPTGSAAYMTLTGLTADEIKAAAATIASHAREIIDAIEIHLPDEMRATDPKNWETPEPVAA